MAALQSIAHRRGGGLARPSRRAVTAIAVPATAMTIALAAVALSASSPAGASVATPTEGAFSITPVRRFVVARPPVALGETRVANTTPGALGVQVFPVLLTQTPEGAFAFDTSPAEVLAARHLLDASPRGFRLAPGAVREVALRWRALPPGARTAAVGVVYQAIPRTGGSPVRIVEQLLGVDVLRLPGRYRVSGALTGLNVAQQAPRVLRFTADARNTGQAVTGPRRLELTIHDQRGARVLLRGLATDIVLPGATRDFPLDVAHRLPAGRYTAYAHMGFGSSYDQTATLPFELAGLGALTAPHLQIGPLLARGTVGQGARVTATLGNTGTAPAHPAIELRLFRLAAGVQGEEPIASRHVVVSALAPRAHRRLDVGFGRLRRGTYRLLASYEDANGTPQTLVADFQAQPDVGFFTRLHQLIEEHALLAPLLILALSAALTAALLIRMRQLKRALAAARRS
jgi:hypothetical protein